MEGPNDPAGSGLFSAWLAGVAFGTRAARRACGLGSTALWGRKRILPMSQFPMPPPPRDRVPPQPPTASKRKESAILALVGGVAVVVGSLMPWATITAIFGTISVAGTQGDGTITLVLGGVLGVLALLDLVGTTSISKWLYVGFGVAAAGVGGFDWVNLSQRLGEAQSEFVQASVGIGLVIVVGGGILAVVGGLVRD